MVNQRELCDRWTPQRAADAREALENWKKKKAIEKVAFGRHEGRWDLRGLPIYTNVGGVTEKHLHAAGMDREYTFVTLDKPPEFHNVKWESIDFSFAEIDHLRLFLSEVRDCLFIGGTFRDWRNWGVRFRDCDFSQADLQNSNIGGASHKGRVVEYANCSWSGGNLKNAHLSDGKFRNCRFEHIYFSDEQIIDASFTNCFFSGQLDDIRFDGRDHDSEFPWNIRADAMVDCNFSEAAMRGVRFLGIDTRTIALPSQGQRVPGISPVARRAFEWAGTADLEPNQKRFLQMYWKGYITRLPDDAEGWINLDPLDGSARQLVEASIARGR